MAANNLVTLFSFVSESVHAAVSRGCKEHHRHIELVETRTLDNMVVPQHDGDINVSILKENVQLINRKFETEASGGNSTEDCEALTHSVKALDISFKIDTELGLEVGRRTKRA
nr:nicotinate-nucleotide pyrophosphorylase [carboxylating], chloroplastic [Tanacetum cinerariifolium]